MPYTQVICYSGVTTTGSILMMKLSDKESALISAIAFNAEVPLTKLQKTLGHKAQTLRDCLRSLVDRGVLRYYPFINVYPLGYTAYSVFFSLAAMPKPAKIALIKSIQLHPLVSWFAEVGGDFQYCISVLGKSISDVSEVLDSLSEKHETLFQEKIIAPQLSLTIFPPKFLGAKNLPGSAISWGPTPSQFSLDKLDSIILSGLMQLRYESRRELASQLDIPFSTLENRIKKLRAQGVIAGFVYLWNPALFGRQSFKLLISVLGFSKSFRSSLYTFAMKHPAAVTFIRSLGSWDYEIDIEVSKTAEATAVVEQLQDQFGSRISRIRLIPLATELKISCYPFLERLPQQALREIAA